MNSSFSPEICLIMDELRNKKTNNPDFLKYFKKLIENHKNAEENCSVFTNILPLIISRFTRIYDDNFSLSERTEDEVLMVIMRDNLQTSFDLAENCQEVLNLICEQQLIYLIYIKSIIKQLLECITLFLKHWECSSKLYKELFYEDIGKISEVLKHLYLIVLNMLESSVKVNEDEENAQELADVLLKISDMSVFFVNLDIKILVCTWKSFGAISTKYSELLQVSLDITVPIQCLNKIIYKICHSISLESEDTGKGPIKILSFLMKVLYKVSDIFYQKLNTFSKELVLLFVEVFNISDSFALKYYLQDEIYNNLEVFLLHLIMGESSFKVDLCDISSYSEDFGKKSIGIVNLFNSILKIISKQSEDCSDINAKSLDVLFRILPNAYAELLCEDNTLYHRLIINMSTAILLQDRTGLSINILMKNIINADPVCAFLALEVFTLVTRNISEDEAFFLLINILYSLNDLHCGSFTSRPDMLFLKCLVHRMFHALSGTFRDQVVKQFNTVKYEQVWRYIKFSLLNFNQVSQLMKPALENVNISINNLHSECTKDSSIYIADCLDLLSTSVLPPNAPEIFHIIKFAHTFWDLELNQNQLIGNNVLQYFIRKMCRITLSLLKSRALHPQLVFGKMTKLSCSKNSWTTVYRIIDDLLYTSSTCLNDSYNQQLIKHISDIITLILQGTTNSIIQQHYFEMFQNLNRIHRDVFNTILDFLNSSTAHKIYEMIENNTIDRNIKERSSFQHKCLTWSQGVITDNINPRVKKPKIEEININSSRSFSGKKENNSVIPVITMEVEQSSASEVIDRLKDEVKCLLRVTKTEKLSAKNVSDLRILTSQINSVMI